MPFAEDIRHTSFAKHMRLFELQMFRDKSCNYVIDMDNFRYNDKVRQPVVSQKKSWLFGRIMLLFPVVGEYLQFHLHGSILLKLPMSRLIKRIREILILQNTQSFSQ